MAKLFEGSTSAATNILHFGHSHAVRGIRDRAGVTFIVDGRRHREPRRIFHQREPRDLTAALNYYCGEMHLGAHGALDDVIATIRCWKASSRNTRTCRKTSTR